MIGANSLGEVALRDAGLLEAALARPRATAFGEEAYPLLTQKAAALLHSIVKNHGLVDGNERLGLAATTAFLGVNGWRLTYSNDEAYELIMAVAEGRLDDVAVIAAEIESDLEPWAAGTAG